MLGAKVIEKHFTLDKNYSNFRDHKLSADFSEMKEIVNFVKDIPLYLGKKNKVLSKGEKLNLNIMRRYPYFNKDLKKNSAVKFSDINFFRSNKNFKTKINQRFIGQKLSKNVHLGERLKNIHFKK